MKPVGLLAGALLGAVGLMAQIGGGGSIQGTVSDPTGAVIPNATVVATNVATGVKTTRHTTGAGVYSLAPLPAGEYNVSVSADGFQILVQEHVVVDALSIVGLNLTLRVGATTEQVTVSDRPPMLSTADARLGQTMRNDEYSSLPLAMSASGLPRNPLSFIYLQPGVQSVGRWGNVMGGQDFSTDVYIEGIAITDPVQQGEGRNITQGISVEAVEQFQVETAGASAMYNGQGASNFVLKSGTNGFHGSAFEYFRNTVLDARGFFPALRPKENQNEFGFTIGGPIQKNKIFFFSSYDGYRHRIESAARFVSLPPLAQRRGDFSALPVAVYDPQSTSCAGGPCARQQFPGNAIPANRISPISGYFQSFLPNPSNGNLQNNYLGVVPIGFNNNNTNNKVDVNLRDKHRLSFLFNHGKRSQATPYRGGGNLQTSLPLPYTETRLVDEVPTAGQARYTYVITPTLLTQLSANYSRLWVPITNATIQGQYPLKAGFKGLPSGEADSSFPEVTFAGPNAPLQWRGTDARAFTEALNTYTVQDNVQWVRGKHALTIGFQAQRMQANEFDRPHNGTIAQFGFSNTQTAGFSAAGALLTNTGNSYASFLLGLLNTNSITEDYVLATGGRFHSYAWWLQDDFKVTPRLTLNLGLRHDIMEPYKEKHDIMSFLNPDLPNPGAGGRRGALQFAGNGENSCKCRTPIGTKGKLFGPRLGIAYSLTPRTVIRAGYALMYTRRGSVGGRDGARNGTGRLGYTASPSFTSLDGGISPAYDWDDGVPHYQKAPFFDPTLNTGFTTSVAQGSSLTYGDPDTGPPRYQNWNFGLQHSLTSSLTLGASYAGSNGHHLGGGGRGFWSNQIDPKYNALGNLLRSNATPANIAAANAIVPGIGLPFSNFAGTIGQLLRPFPQFSGVGDPYGNIGNSNYNSLQITVQKRRADGLTVNFNYTFSKQIDDTGGSRSAYNWVTEKAIGVNDQTHVWNATFVYELPFGKNGHRAMKAVAGGWRLSGIATFRTGQPLGIIAPTCNLVNAGNCYADYNRSFSGPVRINGDYGTGDILGTSPPSFIDVRAFASPAAFTYGDTPRTMAFGLRQTYAFNQDLSLRRDFRIREGWKLGIQADAFNFFNNVRFGGIGANITNANFGRVSSQANTPRVVQFNARVEF